MKLLSILFLNLIICCTYSQSDIIRKYFYPNGNIHGVDIKDEKTGAKEIIYYENGKFQSVGYRSEIGYAVKEWNYFFPTGKLESKGKFVVNKKVVRKRPFGSNSYKGINVRNGKWEYYSESSDSTDVVFYKMGKAIKLKQYDEKKKLIGTFKSKKFPLPLQIQKYCRATF